MTWLQELQIAMTAKFLEHLKQLRINRLVRQENFLFNVFLYMTVQHYKINVGPMITRILYVDCYEPTIRP